MSEELVRGYHASELTIDQFARHEGFNRTTYGSMAVCGGQRCVANRPGAGAIRGGDANGGLVCLAPCLR